jgi:hypothetical protein
MYKKEANILNAIPSGIDLTTYFDSLDLFEKRELIDELKEYRAFNSKNLRKATHLVLISHLVSLVCYFGVQQEWFLYYLVCINSPMYIFLFLKIKSTWTYRLAIEHLEKRMGNS